MGSSKVFMRGPEHSMAQPENVLTVLHGPGRARKWDLGPLWSWHWTCLGTAQQREPRSWEEGARAAAGLAGQQIWAASPTEKIHSETLIVVCDSVLRHSPERMEWSCSLKAVVSPV